MTDRSKDEILAVVSFLAAVFIGLSLYSHNPWDPTPFMVSTRRAPTTNMTGPVGAWLSESLLQMFGSVALLLPVVLVVYAARRFMGREKTHVGLKVVAMVTLVLSFAMLMSLVGRRVPMAPEGLDAGGLIGHEFSRLLTRLLSEAGTYIFGIGAFVVAALVVMPLSLFDLFSAIYRRLRRAFGWGMEQYREHRELRQAAVAAEEEERDADDRAAIEENWSDDAPEGGDDDDGRPIDFLEAEPPPAAKAPKEQPALFKPSPKGGYILPRIEFLTEPPADRPRLSADDLTPLRKELEKKLADFDVEGSVARVQPGPVVSMYEFEPAPGVKINKVISLSDDLAMAMRAERIRVVTNLPGKAAIGIEIPNAERQGVNLREILSSREFADRRSLLSLALGKDIFGKPVVADLARMPHLLVAGATGSGKSVAVNAMILSLLYKASPSELRMVMIDPKMLELSAYRDIPHLFSPVITLPKEASGALRKLVIEMESRYRLLSERGVKNIDGYNASVKDPEDRLPYIVVVIDELADLMLTSAREVEDSIARLAQMARAAGIHLILATQRPSVDVLTGIIKANFPARISFQVSSKVDSRTILDANGAEQLLGKGDMLLMSPGSRLIRIHGAFVDEEEIGRVVEFIKGQGTPSYADFEGIPLADASDADAGEDGERDVLYARAVEIVRSTGQASISYIQRRLKIGYNRAARIMDLMEEDGIVGPPKEAGKPRDILMRRPE